MTMTTRVLLFLAVCISLTLAQRSTSQRCLCPRLSNKLLSRSTEVEDIQIYPTSLSCNRMEIVVTLKNMLQYCLNPKMKVVQKLLRSVMEKQKSPPKPLPSSLPEVR